MKLAKNLIERALRRRDNVNAWIRQTDSFATQQCRVLEVSKTDVRLEVANPDSVPDKFILLFAKKRPQAPRVGDVAARLSSRRPMRKSAGAAMRPSRFAK